VRLWPRIISGLILDRTKSLDSLVTLSDPLANFLPGPNGLVLRLHYEVRSIIQERVRQKGLEADCRKIAATIICGAYPSPESTSCWPSCEQLLLLIWFLASWDDHGKGHDMGLLIACTLGAQTLLSRAYFEGANELVLEILPLQEECLGSDHAEVLRCKYQLARIRNAQGLLDEAEQLFRQVYTTRERTLGPTHRHTINAMQGVADIRRTRENFDEAEALYKCAIAYTQDIRGIDDSLIAMNNLALIYEMQYRYGEAKGLYEKALSALEEMQGGRGQDVLAAMTNLARCYHGLGLFDQAEPLFNRTIAVREQDYGNDHPATLNVYVLLAEMYDIQGRFFEAADLLGRVSDSRAEHLGVNHPKFLEVDELLGLVCGNYADIVQGDLDRAEKCYKRVLSSREKQFDNDHRKMVEITRVIESLNENRAQQNGKALGQSTAEMNHENQPTKDHPHAEIAQQLQSSTV